MLEAAQEQERAALEKAAMDQFGYTLVTNCPKPASEPGCSQVLPLCGL